MARYTIQADSLDELVEVLQEITGGESAGADASGTASTAAPAKRGRKPRAAATAPDPVTPGTAGPTGATGGPGDPGAVPPAAPGGLAPGAVVPGTVAGGGFNPGLAGGGGGFAPGAGQESAQLTSTRNLLDQMAAQHGAANVFNWVKQVLGTAIDQNTPAEQVRDTVLPKLADAQLLDLYQKAGGK